MKSFVVASAFAAILTAQVDGAETGLVHGYSSRGTTRAAETSSPERVSG